MSLLDLLVILVILIFAHFAPIPGGVLLFSVCALIVERVLKGERL